VLLAHYNLGMLLGTCGDHAGYQRTQRLVYMTADR
jgi:hypothetical protein